MQRIYKWAAERANNIALIRTNYEISETEMCACVCLYVCARACNDLLKVDIFLGKITIIQSISWPFAWIASFKWYLQSHDIANTVPKSPMLDFIYLRVNYSHVSFGSGSFFTRRAKFLVIILADNRCLKIVMVWSKKLEICWKYFSSAL